jgi:hypothetical protein
MNTDMLKKNKSWKVLEFVAPIDIIEEEFKESNQDFIIKGVAINETTTLNNVKYVAEELTKAAQTFRDVPILLDHINKVKNIVGRTTQNVNFNVNDRRIEYEARIMDKAIREMIKDGRIKNVSIGAQVDDLIEEEDGSMKAIGIKGLEISLVAVPGDSQATLAQAMQQNFVLKEMMQSKNVKEDVNEDDNKINMEENNMPEEQNVTQEETSEESQEDTKEETPVETSEESEELSEKSPVVNVKVDTSELSEMRKQIAELKDLLKEKKKMTEEVKKESTKGEVSVSKKEILDELDNRILEAAGKGTYALYRDYSKENDNTSLKRLVR